MGRSLILCGTLEIEGRQHVVVMIELRNDGDHGRAEALPGRESQAAGLTSFSTISLPIFAAISPSFPDSSI